MNRTLALSLAMHWTLLAAPAFAQATQAAPAAASGAVAAGLSLEAERARIQAQRDSVEDAFAQAQAACYRKFAVADCQGDARLVRREALADLRRQDASLNAAVARQKGAQQLSRIDAKSLSETELESANRRAQALKKQQARQAGADEKAASKEATRAAAGRDEASDVPAGPPRDEKKTQSQLDREAKARTAALEQEKYELKQKQAAEKEIQRRKRLAGQPETPGKAPPNPP